MPRPKIEYGVIFSTAFERGCIVTSNKPDDLGNFLAIAPDGVECEFSVRMVTAVTGKARDALMIEAKRKAGYKIISETYRG